mgnify:CR=1 FL=1
MKILLNKYKSTKNTNVDNYIGINLQEETEPLAEEQCMKTIDEYEQYVKEKDACTKYRLSVIVSPVCSNILFNRVSEIVYHEGSDDCIDIGSIASADVNTIDSVKKYHKDYLKDSNKKIDRNQAIRDTSYSNAEIGPLVYHCGYDIFNNHFLRQKEFAVVGKLNENTISKEFNTLSDLVRDDDGNNVIESKKTMGSTGDTRNIHLYQYDTVKSFSESVKENLIEDENGWWGFINVSTLPIKNYYEQVLNRTMCNNKSCEQYDMYPDRSLFAFTPKYNKYRDRYEENWKYCLTYPSASITNEVVENGLRCYIAEDIDIGDTEYRNDKTVLFRSDVFHNLNRNSQIELNFDGNKVITTVFSIGDTKGEDTGHYFSVPYDDIKKSIKNEGEIRFRKIVNGGKCQYYFREFAKIPQKNIIGKKYYEPVVNKLSFSHSYYGDENIELLFDRDIDVSGLTDNLGRELSEIYLTVVKNNKGYNEWYLKKDKQDANIEFSHCFGKITSGMDLDEDATDYNIHRLHNVEVGKGCTENEYKILQIPNKADSLEDEIAIDDNTFIGDLVEFSPYTVEETVLEYVYHRFNTAQREYTKDTEYHDIFHEEILTDDDDITSVGVKGFETNKKNIYNTVDGTTGNTFPANIAPEGYYYNPHYLIKLKEFSNTVQQGMDIKINFIGGEVKRDGNIVIGQVRRNHNISISGDTLYALLNGKQYPCKEFSINDDDKGTILTMDFSGETPEGIEKALFFKVNPIKPKGSYDMNDGSGRYLWRDMLSTKELTQDSDLYDSIFTNGAIYLHRNINFYLRRQDPFGKYGLSDIEKQGIPQHLEDMTIGGSTYDYKAVEYTTENTTHQC